MGPATRRKFVRAGSLGQAEPEPSLPRAKRAVSGAGGGQHGVWAQDWGGAVRRWEPSPLPSPSGPSSEHKAERAGSASPAPRRVRSAERLGKGVGTKLFPAPGQTREFSFFQSPRPTGIAGPRGNRSAESDAGWGAEGCRRPERRPIPRRPGSHVLRLGSGPRGRLRALCELLGMQRECSARGSVGPSWGSCQKVGAGVVAGQRRGVCRRVPWVLCREGATTVQLG